MLRYTTQAISEYWDDENYRIFTLKMNSSSELIFISSNATNSRLYDCSESCIGKSLYDIMEKEHADMWHSRFEEWKKMRLASYIAYFEDSSIAWDTTIEVVNDTLFGIGKKVNANKLDLTTFDKHEFFNHYFIHQEDFMLMSLSAQEDDDSFIIESIDSSFNNNFDTFIGQDISAFMFFCSNILDKKVYKKCIHTKKPIHYVEKYVNANCTLYFDMKLFPYIQNSKILLYAKIITEPLYKQTQKKISSIYRIYPETDAFAACEINCEETINPYIIGCNTFFKKLLKETNLSLASIMNNTVFKACSKTLSNETGRLVVEDHDGKSLPFEINVSHISEIRDNIFLVTLMPEKKVLPTIDSVFINLSNREKEMLTYVSNGLTNKYIAKKLNITEGTVKKTVYNGYKKLGISSRVELVNLLKNDL